MGKAARWFRSLLGGGGGKKDQQGKDSQQRPAAVPPPQQDRKRWSFARSSRDSVDSAAAAAIASAAEAAWLKSLHGAEQTGTRAQSKHAMAVAAATAAAADAAVAAAQAAVEVVRLTSQGPGFAGGLDPLGRVGAAVKIQTAFRGFLAKKALRALKALVKLQALVRGYLVRRQVAATLQRMRALMRAQTAARCRAVPPLHHHPPVRPRFSLQEERHVDDTRSEHGVPASYSRCMSASIETASYGGYDRSPKIVQMDTGRTKSSGASSLRTTSSPVPAGEEWWSVSSPLLPCRPPPRIAVRRGILDHDYWCGAPEKPRPATARCMYAPAAMPTKSPCGGKGYMSSTQSSELKDRSHSAPRQRLERKRVPLSEVVLMEARASLSGVNMQRSCNRVVQQEAFDFRNAVVSRFERSSEERDRDIFLQRRL